MRRIEVQTQHIATTTDITQRDVTSLNKQMNVLLASADPAGVLPADEAKLYTDLQPIYMECAQMATRWMQADSAAMRSMTTTVLHPEHCCSKPLSEDIANGVTALAISYGNDLQPPA